MTWGAIGGAAIATIGGGLLGGASGGSASGGTQTVSKDPWAAADPWLREQIKTGQQLQGYYQRNPFNQQQQDAYGLLSQGNNYVNQLVPSLLGQMSNQPGFDRSNPSVKPAGVSFNVPNLGYGAPPSAPSAPAAAGQGTPNPVNMNVVNNPFANGGIPAAPPPAAAPAVDPMAEQLAALQKRIPDWLWAGGNSDGMHGDR